MEKAARRQLSLGRSLAGFALFLASVVLVSALGGMMTASSVSSWYQTLERPSFNPPDWVFAPVWSALYLMMALAAWRVWRMEAAGRGAALALFYGQLAANLGWSAIFFGLRAPGWALAEIVLLLVLITLTMRAFWRIDRVAGALFVPYLLWTAYATLLNASIVFLN
ncbi:TspO and MBR like protein [Tepidicaulis marinus]|jgi:tryptophan-rich sensory protein|uniref:TspO and MBR like protein n=2 Tax=Tepidicaulis marinus TaxID=1333998 RepID=A0A081BEY3_9HYPH|nr:TspO and MBR like protein [Tepidicaulis marinus]